MRARLTGISARVAARTVRRRLSAVASGRAAAVAAATLVVAGAGALGYLGGRGDAPDAAAARAARAHASAEATAQARDAAYRAGLHGGAPTRPRPPACTGAAAEAGRCVPD